jgi:RecA-family ATPase
VGPPTRPIPIFGAPGLGKSLIAPHIAYKVAQGHRVFNSRTHQGPAFYVAAEDENGMQGRVKAALREHGDAPGFYLVKGVSDLLAEKSGHLARLMAKVEALRPTLIILDTLAACFPGLEENSPEAMGRVVKVGRELTKYGAAVVLIHHDTKDKSGTPRGHSLLNGALDVTIHLTLVSKSALFNVV